MKAPTFVTLVMSCILAVSSMVHADTQTPDVSQSDYYLALTKMAAPEPPHGPMTLASGNLGDACESNDDCGVGLCLGTSCQCASDDHCEEDQKCDLGSCIARE